MIEQSFSETELNAMETREWIDSLHDVLKLSGPARVKDLLTELDESAHKAGVVLPYIATTPYINTLPVGQEPPFPGSRELERRLKSIVRWNAMAMVVRANRADSSIGGHISTYASAATLYEIGFNHFWRAASGDHPGDLIYYQGHATPGMYARAYLEGRISEPQMTNFRRELSPGGGLSSYPHPWLMPDFWQFPTVSMGLGPILSIYHARFIRYMENRSLKPASDQKVWAMLGDGEVDEPETLGAITLAAREQLDNLIWVVNCNLQRLDGPVRGNGKIIQELEGAFRGAGWNVIKVIWGADWDPLLEDDTHGLLVKRMSEVVDGQYQKYTVESGRYIREHFFGTDKRLLNLASRLTDEQLTRMRRGGHDPQKVYAAYRRAVLNQGRPTVILAKTVKGYGLGEGGEGKNVTHQQKKMNEEELGIFRTRFGIPISDKDVGDAPFYKPADDSQEMKYLRDRRAALGGSIPSRNSTFISIPPPRDDLFDEFDAGTEGREVSTTMAFVRLLTKLLKDPEVGDRIVPIVPDEARTFGMDPLFRQVGIYSSVGQLYEPVDSDQLLYYKEAKDGQIIEEGITEAGAMSSFIAAGSAYSNHGVATIPFFIYYSMFGHQRIGDLVWAAGDMRTRGFMLGGTAGRTTLNGEGLQHEDGHSHLLAYTVPNLRAYDPAYAYEMATIIKDGIRRMYVEGEDVFYYITLMNENYEHPPKPQGSDEGILRGAYPLRPSGKKKTAGRVILLGSGTILNEVIKAQAMLEETYDVAADVYSVTSYKALYQDAMECDRWNLLHPDQEARVPYVQELFAGNVDAVVASSDYLKALPDSISRWLPAPLHALGTDGYGRSDSREALRDFFEVDARYVTVAALSMLARAGKVDRALAGKAIQDLDIDPEKRNPHTA